ncbi:P-loop containing nucleoside triphosphate hydrolase protein [Amanita muscaria]
MSTLALCLRCRLSLSFSQTEQHSFLYLQRRLRHASGAQTYLKKREHFRDLPAQLPKNPKNHFKRSRAPYRPELVIPGDAHNIGPASIENIPEFLVRNVRAWATHPRIHTRLRDFGIPALHTRPLLRAFAEAVERGELHETDEQFEQYGLTRFAQGLSELSADQAESEVDVIYSTIFFTWASDPKQQGKLIDTLSGDNSSPLLEMPLKHLPVSPFKTLSHIQRLSEAACRQYPAEEFPPARRMHRRIIMHVGPTNSGKTHHALSALAAASTGVYAGPLRLLAHEIWERLNLGEITPIGSSDPDSQQVATTSGELPTYFNDHPSLIRALRGSKRGNLAHGRPCNMITGEEQKIVSESASLLSCTVEMLSTTRICDVAVVDEIQMISDPQRGAAWTSAVLGLCAREIHLCGEETAVPVIQALLRDTGDEIEVRKYERLTPLAVEEQSLEGNWGKVKKGDCVVAFSRSGIFGIKRHIENRTGMRCAVVYGKLPPEVRSEQARLFNDPESGYDVIIGSDAIGMGLNLKIRRIIFDAVAKKMADGSQQRLSAPQVKQIAGRAGRYGLLEPTAKFKGAPWQSPGGVATTLYQSDLPYLRQALAEPIRPLRYARLGVRTETFTGLAQVLPQGASTFTIYEAHIYVGRLGANYRYAMPDESLLKSICQMVDEEGGEVVPRRNERRNRDNSLDEVLERLGVEGKPGITGSLTIEDRKLLCIAPLPWRDARCLLVMRRLVKMYRERLKVDLLEAIEGTGFMDALEGMESSADGASGIDNMNGSKTRTRPSTNRHSWDGAEEVGKINQTTLNLLETFHKVLALYIWMSYRSPASWGGREAVGLIKLRVEHALERCLEGLSKRAVNQGKEGFGVRKFQVQRQARQGALLT